MNLIEMIQSYARSFHHLENARDSGDEKLCDALEERDNTLPAASSTNLQTNCPKCGYALAKCICEKK